jgi:hypothetical protein
MIPSSSEREAPSGRPILMSAPMIRALLDGRKTQTRRIVKPQPTKEEFGMQWLPKKRGGLYCAQAVNSDLDIASNCPYGKHGELLWVRETWRSPGDKRIAYQADGRCGAMIGDGAGGQVFLYHGWLLGAMGRGERLGNTYGESLYGDRWRPSIHMPRWASRLTLELTEVRVERLQDISETDAFAEGIDPDANEDYLTAEHYMLAGSQVRGGCPAVFAYAALWESINSPGSWEANPWVWVLSFRVHQSNVDAFLRARAA